MKKLFCTLAMFVLACSARAQVTLPYNDSFNYTSGVDLAGNGSWLVGNGSGRIKVGGGNLTYSGLQTSGGKDVTVIPTSSSSRTYVNFTSQTSGTFYFSFLLKINGLPTAQSQLVYLSGSTSSDTTPPLGIFIKTGGELGVGINTAAPQFSSAALAAGQTHLVVVGYTFGGSDTVQVWINPASLGGTAPGTSGGFTATHNASLAYFFWNAPASGGGSFETDELRIGSSYAAVTPSSGPPPPPPLTAPIITQALVLQLEFVLRGASGNSNAAYQVIQATNPSLPLNQWTVVGSSAFDTFGHFDFTNPIPPGVAESYYRLQVSSGTNPPAAVPPGISSQPQDQSAAIGQDALFSVTATGTAPLSYQWYFNTNTALTGETNSTLLVSGVASNDVGGYSVTVTNIAGSTNSIVATLTLTPPPTNGDFFVSTTGNDANPGTVAQPFATVPRAIQAAGAGNVIYVRGGTYLPSQTIRIEKSGGPGALIQLLAYPGEHPFLNFSNQPYGSSNRGLLLTTNGSYWQIKGLEIAYAGDNAIKVEGSHNLFEQLVLHHNGDTGLQIGFAHETSNDGSLGAFNTVINCDSYLNYDQDNRGSDADGFACKLHPGAGNMFIGCRAWKNSDDGWDLFETDSTVVISNCWSWHNGDASQYVVVGGSFQGNGNGIKLGGNGTGGSSEGVHYAYNCISFNNNFPGRTRHGFDQNSHHGGNVLYNCVAWNNLYNFFFEDSAGGNPLIFRNNVSFSGAVSDFGSGAGEDHNSWLASDHSLIDPAVGSFSGADFNDIAESAAEAPRLPDGSLPTGFARLVAGSNLIDKGVNVGIPFNGAAPDLGAFESGP